MVRRTALLALGALSTLSMAQISDDFESGWDQTKWPISAPDCNQGGTVSLDTTVAHSGSNSMKVVGGPNGYCGHIFFGTTQVPTGDVYVRVGICSRLQTALGSNHVTFIIMPDTAQGGKHLRIGGQSQVLDYNRESDDATLPDLSPNGIASTVTLPTGAFQCFEYHLGTDGTIETWLNGSLIPGMTVGPGVDNPNDAGWTRASYIPEITGVNFGWEAYSGDVNTVWFDDISIASTRVGCGPGSPGGPGSSTTGRSSTSGPTSTSRPSTTIPPPTSRTTTATGPTQTHYGQCGGIGYSGPTVCASGTTCQVLNPYYSQCL